MSPGAQTEPRSDIHLSCMCANAGYSYCNYAQTDDDAQKSTDSHTSSSSDAETAGALTIGLDELQEDEIIARHVACLEALN